MKVTYATEESRFEEHKTIEVESIEPVEDFECLRCEEFISSFDFEGNKEIQVAYRTLKVFQIVSITK